MSGDLKESIEDRMKNKAWVEFKNMSVVELESKLKENEDELFSLKFKHTSTPLKNPLIIRNLRRTVAKIKTLLEMKRSESK